MTTKKKTTPTKKKATPKKTATAKKSQAKKAAPTTAEKTPARKKMSAVDAAAKVLSEAGKPLRSKEIVEQMAAKGYWKSPGGKTPHATLYSAMLREIANKGDDARFKKTDRGLFAANS